MQKDNITQMDFEIINVTPINKYISECEIKVFYYGKNRNRSYISKAVANQIANSLPRTPIVALYNERIEDYEDHAEEIVINKDGIRFIKKTIPYGAVSEHAPIVWKKVIDINGLEKEYMVAKGYLWTGRYPHLKSIIENPKGQSMEFFEESVVGNWAKFDNDDTEFFIFNEADISALCILGDDVEPCFEDSTIGKPEIVYSLKKNEFKQEFNNFMLELDKVLDHNSTGGGITVKVDNKDELIVEDGLAQHTDVVEEPKNAPVSEFKSIAELAAEAKAKIELDKLAEEVGAEMAADLEENLVAPVEPDAINTQVAAELEVEPIEPEILPAEQPIVPEAPVEENLVLEPEVDVDALQEQNLTLQQELNDLKSEFALLQKERLDRETLQKEEICNKFSILGEDVLNQFKSNLNNYTAEELEKELSVVAFNKGITFNLLTQKEGIVTPIPQRNSKVVPAWIQAVENKEEK